MTDTGIRIGRVYDEAQGGYRVLVDRVWPRGVRKDDLAMDEWAQDVAPSTELRKWFGHDPERFAEFGERYRAELSDPAGVAALDRLRAAARPLTLLTATKDLEHSHALVLVALLSAA